MIRPLAAVILAALLLAGCGDSAPNGMAAANKAAGNKAAPVATPDVARVRLETEAGPILVELDGRRAPLTTANFLAYVDQHRFDGTSFYRAARTRGAEGRGFIQGGIRRNYRLMLAPVAHEPTSTTGLRHGDGTISMARTDPGSAMGNFFITVGAMPQMDAHGPDQGFAAFGRVVEGMDVVRRILAAPTVANAGSGAMRGQMIAAPVRIVSARRAPGPAVRN
jgi:peptidyl-prolyl cis-trans isomerase A (cyclophilin A)